MCSHAIGLKMQKCLELRSLRLKLKVTSLSQALSLLILMKRRFYANGQLINVKLISLYFCFIYFLFNMFEISTMILSIDFIYNCILFIFPVIKIIFIYEMDYKVRFCKNLFVVGAIFCFKIFELILNI